VSDDLAPFWIHDVKIERLAGPGAYGLTYDTAETVSGLVDDEQRLVVNMQGQTVTSTATVYLPVGTADVPVQSRITLLPPFGNRAAEVIKATRHDSGALGLPDHLELSLQ
jgi:hypothetical protein